MRYRNTYHALSHNVTCFYDTRTIVHICTIAKENPQIVYNITAKVIRLEICFNLSSELLSALYYILVKQNYRKFHFVHKIN